MSANGNIDEYFVVEESNGQLVFHIENLVHTTYFHLTEENEYELFHLLQLRSIERGGK